MFNINDIDQISILNVMTVRGYCVWINGILRTFVCTEDIARESGLTKENTKSYAPNNGRVGEYSYETIRWDRFESYMNDAINMLKSLNSDIIPLIQPELIRTSYIPYELALMILMRCNSSKALEFQAKLAAYIVPELQRQTIDLYKLKYEKQNKELEDMKECNKRILDTLTERENTLTRLLNKSEYIDQEIERARHAAKVEAREKAVKAFEKMIDEYYDK